MSAWNTRETPPIYELADDWAASPTPPSRPPRPPLLSPPAFYTATQEQGHCYICGTSCQEVADYGTWRIWLHKYCHGAYCQLRDRP